MSRFAPTFRRIGLPHLTLIMMGALPAYGEPDGFISRSDMPTVPRDALAPVNVGEIVETDRGAIRGAPMDSTIAFLGVPYAAAPVGELRWRPPADVAPWSGVRDVLTAAAACANISGTRVVSTNEDCLRLNIRAPAGRSRPRPVMVWIHGGGNFTGSALFSAPPDWGNVPTDGGDLVSQLDVVFVSVEFRQGALGFLAHPAFDAENASGSSGNYGVLDIMAALQWVQRNVAAFGGDPRRVMVFGNSSGADDICVLLASPLAQGLFSALVMESAFGRCETPDLAAYEAGVGQTNVTRMGCAGAEDVAACLRSLPVLTVLQKQIPGNLDLMPRIYTPVTDGYVLTASPITMINNSQISPVPVILGSNEHETSRRVAAIANDAEYVQAITTRFGSDLVDDILVLYPSTNYANPRAAFIALTTDEIHTCPTRRVSLAATKARVLVDDVAADPGGHSRVYRYFFRQVAATDPVVAPVGSFHTLEIMYLFAGWTRYLPSAGEVALSDAMRSYWSSFAHNRNPSYNGGVHWPQTNVERIPYLELDTSIEARDDATGARCDFWDGVSGYILSRGQGYAAGEQPFYSKDDVDAEPQGD